MATTTCGGDGKVTFSITTKYEPQAPAWDGIWKDTAEAVWAHQWTNNDAFSLSRKWWERLFYRIGDNIRELVTRTDSIRRKINAQAPVIEHAVGDIDWLKKQVSKLLADNESLRSVALHRWRDAVRDNLVKLKCKDVRAAMDLPVVMWPDTDDEASLPSVNKACYDEVYDAVGQYREDYEPCERAALLYGHVHALFDEEGKKGGKR